MRHIIVICDSTPGWVEDITKAMLIFSNSIEEFTDHLIEVWPDTPYPCPHPCGVIELSGIFPPPLPIEFKPRKIKTAPLKIRHRIKQPGELPRGNRNYTTKKE